jgi:DNA-binding transcriptional regulator YhcF (GntR family)
VQSENIYRIIAIDEYSITPKYLQISNSIIDAIDRNLIGEGYLLPSINDLSFEMDISRDTAEKAYKHLKKMGVIGSVPGKGFYISHTQITKPLRIFLLFNKLSPHKKIIYDSFVDTIGKDTFIDFYIYNNDFGLFRKLIAEGRKDYSHYVIIPHFIDGGENAQEVINTLPKDKLIILDQMIPGIDGDYASVYEDFSNDIYAALEQALPRLVQYQTLKIIFPSNTYHPKDIIVGFKRFCLQFAFNYEIVHDVMDIQVEDGDVYLVLMEQDLVSLIERLLELNKVVGKDVGVISYNETPMKKIILNGITTISTDFEAMGKQAAELILAGRKEHIANPFRLTMRSSI